MGILDSLTGGDPTVTNSVKYPKWYTKAAKQLIKYGNKADKWLAKPYRGKTVADLNQNQRQLIRKLQNNVGDTNPLYKRAMRATREVMNYDPDYNYKPDKVKAGSFLEGDINAYMNPYIQNVENQALSRLNDQRLLTQSANADAAAAAGAFGSSRQGIREALTDAETSRSAGELSANLRNQGFNTAAGLMEQDMARRMQAQMANQQTGLQNAQFGANLDLQGQQLNLNAADQYGDQATDMQNAYLQGVQGAMTGANMQQQYRQDLLNARQARYNAMRNYPLEIFNTRLAALSGSQVQPSTVQTTSGGGGLASGLMGALGGAMAGSTMGPWGTLAGAIGGGFMGYSDKNAKTNIEKIGKDPNTGLDLFAYDYKSDVKAAKKNGTPMPMKRVGPMAQDIEKKYPGSTRKIGGKQVVTNLGFGG